MEQQTQDMLVNLLATVGNMGGKGSVGDTLGNFAKSRIQSKNYAAMLQKLLGGLPPGFGFKADGGPDGKISFTGPAASITENQHLPGFSGDTSGMNTPANPFDATAPSLAGTATPTPAPTSNASGGGFVNPSLSPLALNSANLEGLTPGNITQALQLQQGQQHINIQGENTGIAKSHLAMAQRAEPLDLLTKMAQIQHINMQSEKLGQGDPQDKPYPVPVSGLGPNGSAAIVTQRQWEHIPEKDRSYSIYAYAASKLGPDAKIMSKTDWELLQPTEQTKFLTQLGLDPKLMARELELKRAGATNIDLGPAKKQAMNTVEAESFFADPKWVNQLDTHMNSDEVKQTVFDAGSTARQKLATSGIKDKQKLNDADAAATANAKASVKASWIDDRIRAGGGTLAKDTVWENKDKKTLIWTVRWPSGLVQTLRYKVR